MTGRHVTLRPLTSPDAAAIAAWGDDADFARAAGWSRRTGDEREAHWASLIAAPPADLIRLGVDHGGDLVGYVDLHGHDESHRELGFAVRRASWGQGLGTAAAGAAVSHGFTALGLQWIWAEADNARSAAVLTRIGMRRVGGRRFEISRRQQGPA